MPAAINAYADDPKSEVFQAIERAAIQELRGRQSAFNLASDYYYGMHKKHLLPDGTNTEDNVTVNLIGLIVDKCVSALMGTNEQGMITGPDFEIAEEVERQQQLAQQPALRKMMLRAAGEMRRMMGMPQESENPAKTYLDALWEANQKEIFLHDLAFNGGLGGQCYVKIDPLHPLPDPDGDTSNLYPRLIVLNPANVTKFWDRLDATRTLWYTISIGRYYAERWDEGSFRQDIVRNVNNDGSDASGWTIYEYQILPQKNGWQLTNTVNWNYSFSPIVDWKNLPRANYAYGANDLDVQVQDPLSFQLSRGLVGLNDSLNFTLSNMQRIIKFHAMPRTIGIGILEDGITETSINGFFTTSASKQDADIRNLEMQSDLGSSLNLAALIRSSLFSGARELDPNTVQDKLGALTNFGIRVLNQDKLSKLGTKRLLYGAGLEAICRYCLEISNIGTGIEIVTKWPDPLPSDPLATAQALQLDRANGLSRDTYLERRGYDPEVEAQKREREQAEAVRVQNTVQQGNTNEQMVNQGNAQRQMNGNTPPNGATNAR